MSNGAYTRALLTLNFEIPLILSMIIAALVTRIVGVIIGFPGLRLEGV